jgi:hypothetical protein
VELHWWSIEVRHGEFPATRWRDAHNDALTEAAITHRVRGWGWVELPWGVVFELAFADAEDWLRFRTLPAVRAALDSVPDRITGLYIYPGRGGSAGAGRRRVPRPPLGAGAAPIPQEPEPVVVAGREPEQWRPPLIATFRD